MKSKLEFVIRLHYAKVVWDTISLTRPHNRRGSPPKTKRATLLSRNRRGSPPKTKRATLLSRNRRGSPTREFLCTVATLDTRGLPLKKTEPCVTACM
ncbi:ORF054L [Largemouth bass ulcerative syndrome virus]|nr:ORF054L [Largemouth bass ulcerative syndrome virus]